MEEMRRFTLLALISEQKTYYFNLPSCVRTNLPSCLAREMAMICGQETDYFKPSCAARNISPKPQIMPVLLSLGTFVLWPEIVAL